MLEKLKIVHLSNNDAKCCIGITQGLLELDTNLYLSRDYKIFGEVKQLAEPDLIDKMKQADIIFSHDKNGWPYKDFFQNYDLWKKVINYDYGDSFVIDPIYEYASNYFKRSMTIGPQRIVINVPNVTPIHYCALNEYYLPQSTKDIDVGCFFDPKYLIDDIRRSNVLWLLMAENLPNSIIGQTTINGREAHLKILEPSNNVYCDYLKQLNRCKIVFTANPMRWEGKVIQEHGKHLLQERWCLWMLCTMN